MAGDFYTLKLIADIDDKKSDSEIQKYISEIQKKVSTDEKSKLKITVTPIMDRVQDPNNAKKYIDVQKDLVLFRQPTITNLDKLFKRLENSKLLKQMQKNLQKFFLLIK